ncbi:MAG: hypothetical protein AB1490_04195 [Pseudomonadota bacterium]
MSIRSLAILLSGAALLVAANSDSAQAARNPYSSVRLYCLKKVGAYYNPGTRRYRFYGARSSAHVQSFYDCLDAQTINRR